MSTFLPKLYASHIQPLCDSLQSWSLWPPLGMPCISWAALAVGEWSFTWCWDLRLCALHPLCLCCSKSNMPHKPIYQSLQQLKQLLCYWACNYPAHLCLFFRGNLLQDLIGILWRCVWSKFLIDYRAWTELPRHGAELSRLLFEYPRTPGFSNGGSVDSQILNHDLECSCLLLDRGGV